MNDTDNQPDDWEALEAFLLADADQIETAEAALARLSHLASIERLARVGLQSTVDRARALEVAWADIADASGTSPQNAHKKWHNVRATDSEVSPAPE